MTDQGWKFNWEDAKKNKWQKGNEDIRKRKTFNSLSVILYLSTTERKKGWNLFDVFFMPSSFLKDT